MRERMFVGIVAALFCLFNPMRAGTTDSTNQPNGEGYITVNGARLFYKVIGHGEPILILHGGPGLDHTYFLPQMAALATTNKLVFLISGQAEGLHSMSTPTR